MADSAGQAAASTAVADVPEAIVEGGGDVVAAVKGNEDGAVEKEQGADMTNTDEVKSMEAMDDGEKEQAEIKTEIEASKPEVGNGQTGVEVPAHEKKGDLKRENPEGVTDKTDEERPDAKKQKLENGEKGEIPLPVQLGPKQFNSALEMFTWCYELLHGWSWNHDVNEYEFMGKTQRGDTLKIHYTGTLKSDGSKFDSSLDRGEPFEFKLGEGQVIQGWDQGLRGMCIGEKRRLTIPPSLGYGDRGAGEKIPGGATLVFETELIGIE